MYRPIKTTIITFARHRNGISGAPFDVFLFHDNQEKSRKVAILFREACHCAVLDVDKVFFGDIEFGSNSYRGDCYEPSLRKFLIEQRGE